MNGIIVKVTTPTQAHTRLKTVKESGLKIIMEFKSCVEIEI